MLEEVRNAEKCEKLDGDETEVHESEAVIETSSNDYEEIPIKEEFFEELFSDKESLRLLHTKLDRLLLTYEVEDESRWRQIEWENFSKVLDNICFVVFVSYFVLSLILVNIRIFIVY